MSVKKQIYVADTCAFLSGLTGFIEDVKIYTVPEVLNELKNNVIIMEMISKGIRENKIIIKNPSEESVNYISDISLKTGDSVKLSRTDLNLIALGWEFSKKYNVIIISDDYSIQNMCAEIGVVFKRLREKGISKRIKWIKYCPACFREETDSNIIKCEVCGTRLKFKPDKRIGKEYYGGKYKRSG